MTNQPDPATPADQPEIIDEWAELLRLPLVEVHVGFTTTGKVGPRAHIHAMLIASRMAGLHLEDHRAAGTEPEPH